MSVIFNMAGLSAANYQYARNADQALVYDAVARYTQMANEDRVAAQSFFVSGQTAVAQKRKQLGITGKMQKHSEESNADSIRRTGSYDVAFPLFDYSDEISMTDIDFAYMTPAELQVHVDGVIGRGDRTYRSEVLTRIFKNTNTTVVDKRLGSLTVVPLANTDGTLYPPLIGTDSEADSEHYVAAGYLSAAINDTNNPIETLVNLMIGHYGRATGGIPVAVLINTAQRSVLEALTNFVPQIPNTVNPGNDTDTVINNVVIPGEAIGTINGALISVWDWIPATYMACRHLGVEAPLQERVDTPETGLPSGLQMVNGPNTPDWPLLYNAWRYRFGLGTDNRLSAAVLQLTAGAYSIPTIA